MQSFVPKQLFLTNGVGHHTERLESFELALKNAGISHLNLVSVSSIIPPGCRIISRQQGERQLSAGEITFAVLAKLQSNEPHRILAASIGIALPRDHDMYGYLSEHESFGQTAQEAGDYAEDLAASMLASSLGLHFDDAQSWDEKKQIWKISGEIVTTRNVTQSAVVKPNGHWTTVIAAAVMLLE